MRIGCRALNFAEFCRACASTQFWGIQFWSILISHSIFRNSLLVDSHLAFNFQKFTFGRLWSRIQFWEIHCLPTIISHEIYICHKNFLDKKQSLGYRLHRTKISADFINYAHTYAPCRFTKWIRLPAFIFSPETISQHRHSFYSILGVKSRYWHNFMFVPYLELELFTKIISSKMPCKITISARFRLNRSHLSHSHRNFYFFDPLAVKYFAIFKAQ